MSLRNIQVLEGVFAVGGIIGFLVKSEPRWSTWLCWSLFMVFDTWRCLKVGEISTGPDYKWYGFTFSRDDSPLFFTSVVVFRALLTLGFFFAFLCSL